MQGLCNAVSTSGFWQGLWDGLTAPITLIASLFFNVQFYDVCARSWWYNAMFLIGVIIMVALGFFEPRVLAMITIVCVVAFVVWFLFANILYVLAFIGICIVGGLLYHFLLNPRRPLRQSDGSEVLPPLKRR